MEKMKTLAEGLAEMELEQQRAAEAPQPSTLGSRPEPNQAPLVRTAEQPTDANQAPLVHSYKGNKILLSTLGSGLISELAALGEELLEPRAEPSALGSEPGAGPRVLGGSPGRLLTVLASRQAQQAGVKGGNKSLGAQSPERRREIAMLGVEARKRNKQ